ncbi:MAG: hypothetical protein HZA51_05370 [Planctomycetes bacterium]|nr:hypothetical protein [Planctomycetota bacterium]
MNVHFRLIPVILSVVLAWSMACRNEAPREKIARPSATSPAEIAALMHELAQQHDYQALRPLIIPEAAADTIAFLAAAHEVIDSGRRLQASAEKRYSGPAAEGGRLAAMENNLGLFSRDVEFFSQSFKGDRAVVTLQEGEHVPLVHAVFELREDQWLYAPDPTPKDLPWELHLLATQLVELGRRVDGGLSIFAFLDAFDSYITPQVVKIMTTSDQDAVAMNADDNGGM